MVTIRNAGERVIVTIQDQLIARVAKEVMGMLTLHLGVAQGLRAFGPNRRTFGLYCQTLWSTASNRGCARAEHVRVMHERSTLDHVEHPARASSRLERSQTKGQ